MTEHLDRWADWILRFGFIPDQSFEDARAFASGRLGNGKVMLDRILAERALSVGGHVLDVGAGVGQLALEARKRVGEAGRVVALDVSVDALKLCVEEACMQPDGGLASIAFVGGDAVELPLRDASFDHVLTRSVLIYVGDKAAAAKEFYRVLREGGRVSMFEPINRVSGPEPWNLGLLDVSELQPEHGRVVAWLHEHEVFREEMCGFDERDLVAAFVDAGFASVRVRYEHAREVLGPGVQSELTELSLSSRPNPGARSIREAADAVLGEDADAYLARFKRLRERSAVVMQGATAILNAVR